MQHETEHKSFQAARRDPGVPATARPRSSRSAAPRSAGWCSSPAGAGPTTSSRSRSTESCEAPHFQYHVSGQLGDPDGRRHRVHRRPRRRHVAAERATTPGSSATSPSSSSTGTARATTRDRPDTSYDQRRLRRGEWIGVRCGAHPLRASFIYRSIAMRLNLTTALPLAFVLVSGCWRRTEISAVWHEPGSGLLNFNRAVAVFATTDEAMRRAVEDELAMKFPNAVPAYRVVPNASDVNKDQILPQMRAAGFDGAIVMRVTNVTERLNVSAGNVLGLTVWVRRLLGIGVGVSVQPRLREHDADRLRRDEHLQSQERPSGVRRPQRDVRSVERRQARFAP